MCAGYLDHGRPTPLQKRSMSLAGLDIIWPLYADVSLPLLPPPSWANRRNAMAWALWHISFSLLKLEHNEVLKKGSGYRQMNWLGHFGFEGLDADYSPRLRTLRSQQPGPGQNRDMPLVSTWTASAREASCCAVNYGTPLVRAKLLTQFDICALRYLEFRAGILTTSLK